jgi:hypothetical protein
MSLYREARSGRRRLWLGAGAVMVVVAAVVVVAVLVAQGGEPSAAERLESLQDDVRPALAALELVPIHYESTNATTHAAAADQLAVARDTVAANAADLRSLDRTGNDELVAELDALDALVRTTGRSAEVERAASEAAAQLRQLVRID